MARICEFVVRSLPLPPFHVWYQDVCKHPEAHWDEAGMVDVRPGSHAPIALTSRTETLAGVAWNVEVNAHQTGEVWRGHLAFQRAEGTVRCRTGEIFRETNLQSMLDRFRELDRASLEAFLRSVLP
jgi:hypothetical protein